MKYKITLNDRVYEVEVEKGVAEVVKEYDYVAPAPVAAPVSAAPAADPSLPRAAAPAADDADAKELAQEAEEEAGEAEEEETEEEETAEGDEFAECQIRVGVGRSRHGCHGGELGVAQACEKCRPTGDLCRVFICYHHDCKEKHPTAQQ